MEPGKVIQIAPILQLEPQVMGLREEGHPLSHCKEELSES